MAERTTVRLPQELLSRAKRKAAAQGRTLTSLIEDGLRRVVAEDARPARHRALPRISKARGGLMPGIDLDDIATLQGIEDRDSIRRTGRGR
jgi:hypothetical protein